MVGVRELFEIKSLENLIKKQVFPIFQSIKERAYSIIHSLRVGLRKFFEKKKAPENEVEDAS
jgi:hypothetical protein